MLIRTGLRVAAIAAASALVLPAARAAAASVVTIEDDSANINTFQALNSTHTHSTNKDGQSFVRFPENLLPPTLKGPEGTADVFAQQASTIVTPSTSPFPTQPVHGIGVSGRARSEAVKAHNGLAGVPVADSQGSFSADFTASGATPFQFDGALLATNDDPQDCTTIDVQLSGPISRTFATHAGGQCPSGPKNRGFVVTGVLPAGDYNLSVDYDAEVNPGNPGTLTGLAEVDVNLQFFPPNTQITGVHISGHQATFRFKDTGTAKGNQCALVHGHVKVGRFESCSSPKTYKGLKPGRYKFEARAVGLAGPDATPAIRKFTIKS